MNRDLIPDRIEYGDRGLSLKDLLTEPIEQLKNWLVEAVQQGIPEANAVCLSTVNAQGHPDSRIVLVKEVDPDGLVFYTNYESNKGIQLSGLPFASIVFWWQSLRRQVRLQGSVARVSSELSDLYFASRPRDSQLGAWASLQSAPVSSREEFEKRLEEMDKKFPGEVPRPPYWGGYRLRPARLEFWQGRDNRLHDRFAYTHRDDGSWLIERLMP